MKQRTALDLAVIISFTAYIVSAILFTMDYSSNGYFMTFMFTLVLHLTIVKVSTMDR